MATTQVLLVEDVEETAILTREFMAQAGDYQLVWADSLTSARRTLADQQFDIILLDFNLPDADGLQSLKTLNNMGVETPVVVITGRGDEETAVRAVKGGAADYIVKRQNYLDTLPDVISRVIQQHELRRAVAEAEARYRYLFEQANDGIIVTDLDGGILDANRNACNWLQHARFDLIGRNIADFERPDGVPSQWYRTQLANEGELVYEISLARADGDTFTAEVSARRVQQGETTFHQYFIRDITHRKQMEGEILQRSRELAALSEVTAAVNRSLNFNEVLQNALSGVMRALGADCGAILLIDGTSLALAVQQGLSQVFVDTTQAMPRREFETHASITANRTLPPWLADEDVTAFLITPFIHKSTLQGYLLLADRDRDAFTGDESNFVRVNCDRIAVAIENARLLAELQELVEATRVAQAQLVRAARLSAVGELAAGVAHQINNPLTTVIADAQLLVKSLDEDHPGHVSADAIYQAGWRAQRVVQGLLNFARPEDEAMAPTHINDTVMSALSLLGPYLARSGVVLQTTLGTQLPQISANGHQLEEMWINLLLNARDALSDTEGANIHIRTNLAAEGDAIVIEVSDNGAGIPEDDRETIFEPFHTTKKESGGTGLGLSVCQTIAQHHGGTIKAANHPDGGAVFSVLLPISEKFARQRRPPIQAMLNQP